MKDIKYVTISKISNGEYEPGEFYSAFDYNLEIANEIISKYSDIGVFPVHHLSYIKELMRYFGEISTGSTKLSSQAHVMWKTLADILDNTYDLI